MGTNQSITVEHFGSCKVASSSQYLYTAFIYLWDLLVENSRLRKQTLTPDKLMLINDVAMATK